MKGLKEIEDMTLEDLLVVADDESVSAPEGLSQRLQNLMLASTLSEEIRTTGSESATGFETATGIESVTGPETAPGQGTRKVLLPFRRVRPARPLSGKTRKTFLVAIAASLTLLLGIGLSIRTQIPSEPVDTFDDPRLAYAAVEEVFSRLSDNVGKGMAIASQANQKIEKADNLINQIYR